MTTNEQRAAFLEMCRESATNDGDRVLANAVLERAMTTFLRRKGRRYGGPYTLADLERVMGPNSSVVGMVNETLSAITASRLLERERCALVIEEWFSGMPEHAALSRALSTKIRSGE